MAEQNQNSLGLENTSEIENVNEFKFEPIKGYPMLNWRGKRPFTSTQYYPAQLKEVYGEEIDGWRNKIYWGDNLQVMSHLLKEFRGKVDLIYIDPPFDSKIDYKKKIQIKNESVEGNHSSFEEKQYTDIWNNDEYFQFLYERLCLARELLAENGQIYIHVDPRKSPFVRLIMNELFGEKCFRNEVVWRYRRMPAPSKDFQKMHDVLIRYSKRSSGWFFNQLYEENSPSTLKAFGTKKIVTTFKESGEKIVTATEEESQGTRMSDVWEISYVQGSASKERTDGGYYPTQKPEALLSRVIESSCPEGGIVLDFFMGSGTTAATALKLGRRFIGADINQGAVLTSTSRLIKVINEHKNEGGLNFDYKSLTGFEVHNVNQYDIFRNPIEARELLIEALEIQKFEFNNSYDGEKDGRMVKIMPVNRISTRSDIGDLISGFDYKTWQARQNDKPNQPVEKILLVCMGHEPSLKAELELAAKPFKIDVEVLDILRDKSNLEFKRDSEALVVQKNGELVIERFYPMNLLQKLSLQKETVTDWREMVESIMIDWNYDGAVLQPSVVDIPEKAALVSGKYKIPADSGTIRIKITDVLSESWEGGING